ncbi:hypothetical protein GCM10025858_15220 [Alicyclobacillus sacchari]|nr:hypothetical protein GCM10025858_15220 [Alicyclobacillus sacchari]
MEVESLHGTYCGVDLPRDKRVEVGLTYIFGIGRTTANQILATRY